MNRVSHWSARFWSAPVLWRFGSFTGCPGVRDGIGSAVARLVGKRQGTAAVQDAGAPV